MKPSTATQKGTPMNDVIKQNETAVQLTLGEDFLWSNQPVKLVIKLKADLEKKTLYSSSGEDDGHLKQVIEKWLPAEAEDNEHSVKALLKDHYKAVWHWAQEHGNPIQVWAIVYYADEHGNKLRDRKTLAEYQSKNRDEPFVPVIRSKPAAE